MEYFYADFKNKTIITYKQNTNIKKSYSLNMIHMYYISNISCHVFEIFVVHRFLYNLLPSVALVFEMLMIKN